MQGVRGQSGNVPPLLTNKNDGAPLFDSKLFRASAIQHYLDRERDGVPVPLRIAPAWTWWLFIVLLILVSLALVLSVILRVEVQGTGRGVFHVAGGARPLVVQTSGRVIRVEVRRGQKVAQGELLLELESASIQSQLLEADRALAQMEQITRPAQVGLDRLAELQIQEAIRRRDAQKEQLASQEQSVRLFERKFAATEELGRHGLVSTMNIEEARESLSQAQRNVNSARQLLMASEQEIASLNARRSTDNLRNIQDMQALRTRRDALVYSLAQTRLVATEAGTVEGFHVQVGDVLNAGQSVGRLLSGGETLKAFALLVERDSAQVHSGDIVRLEVDQYPFTDWGTLKAEIMRVGKSPVAATELRELFGEQTKFDGQAYLVELAIPIGQTAPVAHQPLQSGMAFQARFVLKRQRPITILLEPLRRWIE